MFPTASFSVVLEFAKGSRPWSADVLDSALDLVKWTYRAFVEKSNPLAIGSDGEGTLEVSGPADALEQFGAAVQASESGAKAGIITPALVSFVVQYLMQLVLDKLSKRGE